MKYREGERERERKRDRPIKSWMQRETWRDRKWDRERAGVG